MCNLTSETKGQQAILDLAEAMADRTGNMPCLPDIFPDYAAPLAAVARRGKSLRGAVHQLLRERAAAERLAAAGILCRDLDQWTSVRKVKEGETTTIWLRF